MLFVNVCVCVCMCMCVCVYVLMCVHVCVCMMCHKWSIPLLQNSSNNYHLLLKIKQLIVWFCHTIRVNNTQLLASYPGFSPHSLGWGGKPR